MVEECVVDIQHEEFLALSRSIHNVEFVSIASSEQFLLVERLHVEGEGIICFVFTHKIEIIGHFRLQFLSLFLRGLVQRDYCLWRAHHHQFLLQFHAAYRCIFWSLRCTNSEQFHSFGHHLSLPVQLFLQFFYRELVWIADSHRVRLTLPVHDQLGHRPLLVRLFYPFPF